MPRIPLLIAVCLVVMPAHAKYGGSGMAGSAATSTYVFVSDQSTVVQTGGIAYVHWTYSIEGQFELTVDPNAGTASFAHVDANATDDSPFKRALDPNHVFNMTSLVGTVVDDATVKFTGKASDGSDVLITVTLQDNLAHLIGQTIPPPNSADFFIFNLNAVAQRKYGGGSGTADDPYQIATVADLIALGNEPNDYDKHFILTADIDLDPNLPGRKVFDKAIIAPDTNAVEDYFQGTPFSGVFDGNGHTISHLTIKGAGYLGLFGNLEFGAKVKDLGVVDVNIAGSGDYVGALAVDNGGTVTRCYSTGTVTGSSDGVGGLVAHNDGLLTACYTTGSVTKSRRYVGGLIGSNEGSLAACYATGSVVGNDCIGGLVGFNNGWIKACYATGDVNCSWWRVGGLVGINFDRGTLIACYATGSVTGGSEVGGLVGRIGWNFGRLDDCYATGSVAGTSYVGGLVGSITSDGLVRLRACYAAGSITGSGDHLGGLVGRNGSSIITACFWDVETSGSTTSDGGTGKTTAEMQTAATFLDAAWDFVGESQNGTENIWAICEGLDYPKLAWQFVIGDYNGDGHTDFMDFCIFGQRWLGNDSSFWCPGGGTDLTNDAFVDFEDLMELADNWLTDISHRGER